MAQQNTFIATVFMVSLLSCNNSAAQKCGVDAFSSYQKMLKGHTFKSFQVRSGSSDCREACNADVRCQSYNYVIFKDICELNNRSKEARPEDFVESKDRYYITKAPKRVPLGSIQELPADSCKEIKASEREIAVDGNYWLDPTRSGDSLVARCDMATEVPDYCIKHQCSSTQTCVNGQVGYTCVCISGWTGSQCELAVKDCASVALEGAGSSYKLDASLGSWPGFCRGFHKEEINAGDPYTLSVELFNRDSSHGANYGHPGVAFNVIDMNNYDLVYFRPHRTSTCYQLGYVSNGNFVSRSHASCPNGPPGGRVWFTVRVVVSSDKTTDIYLNNDLVTSLTAHFSTKGRGGMLVAHGFGNIVRFRNFSLIGT